jgi:UDP-N-acetylmuramoyl-L-alanyl-D-glutamate--2,6-diaminopimelate ligase
VIVREKSLAELARAVGIAPPSGWQTVFATGVTEDSRRVVPGHVFVAVRGTRHDGADYVGEAIARGAIAVVAERSRAAAGPWLHVDDARTALARLAATFHDHPTRELFTVGVTGTNGKTTVCHLIAYLLGEADTALISTVTNEDRRLRAITTPSSPELQRMAREARDLGKRNLVIEASSIGLEQRRLDDVDFDVAAYTNLTHDHLDLHVDRAAYLQAKTMLFRSLKPEGWAVVNADDRTSKTILAANRGRAVTYAIGRSADLTAVDLRFQERATSFRIRHGEMCVPTCVPLPGAHNVSNALAAVAVGLCYGHSLVGLAGRLRDAPRVAGRCQFFERGDGVTAVVDFAHNPDALERTLRTLGRAFGRVISVFGCPGDSDRAKRPLMGRVSARYAARTVLTADNPKNESPDVIIDEIAAGLDAVAGVTERIIDRGEAIRHAVAEANSGDVVLIAGKGHETYQIVADRFEPFSDVAVLEELGFTPSRGVGDGLRNAPSSRDRPGE